MKKRRCLRMAGWVVLVLAGGAADAAVSRKVMRAAPPAEQATSAPAASPTAASVVHRIEIADQIITPTVAQYVTQSLRGAEAAKAAALLIELNTPGGLLSATQEIVQVELNATIPIIVYVAPKGARAASAGVFITMAAHVAAMAPSTRIGAAHPVSVGGEGSGFKWPGKGRKGDEGRRTKDEGRKTQDDDVMGGKILNDTVAWIAGIAKERHRDSSWAEAAVRESRSSTAEEARDLGVVDLLADSTEALLAAVDGRKVDLPSGPVILRTKGAVVRDLPMTWRQQLLQVLANPNIAYILMILGFYGLLFEITHPGAWVPGIAGAICLILAFYALQTLPTNYAGLALILLAVVLLIAEIKVTSYGLLTVAALGALFLGSLMLFSSSADFLRVSMKVIIPVLVGTGAVAAFLTSLAVAAQRRPIYLGKEGLIGEEAVVEVACAPIGKVFVNGELWEATCATPVVVGARVKIMGAEGMRLTVKPV